jgi:hypothetical protein
MALAARTTVTLGPSAKLRIHPANVGAAWFYHGGFWAR